MAVMPLYGCSFLAISLLGVVLLLPTPAACTSDTAADPVAVAAHYSLEHVYLPAGKASCIPGVVYEPAKPLTQPPGLVVMLPALGQNAFQQGLHTYAHAFASSGLSVLLVSAPASLATPSLNPEVQHLLLNCGKRQEQQQQADIPAILYGSTFRAAVSRYVQLLADEGRVDAGRVAYWGAEWGAVAAVQAAVEQKQGAVQALILQTPWLGGTRAAVWQRLTSQHWLQAATSLGLALLDSFAALLRLPCWLRATVPLSGPPVSAALLQLRQSELYAHQAAVSSQEAPAQAHKIGAAALLGMLLWGNPIYMLLPQLQVPIGYYAAAGDSDTPLELYVANSKRAKYVSFHVSSGSRYRLLASDGLAAASSDLLLDQTLLLVALLGDVDLGLIPDVDAAEQQGVVSANKNHQGYEQQQQQQESIGEGVGAGGAAGRLFPFQQPGELCSLDEHCEMAGGRAVQQKHATASQVCK